MHTLGKRLFDRIQGFKGVQYMLEWSEDASLSLLVVVREINPQEERDIYQQEMELRAETRCIDLDVIVVAVEGRDVEQDLSGAGVDKVHYRKEEPV